MQVPWNMLPAGTKNTFEAGDVVNKMSGKFAGADFFTMFSYPLLQGTAANALSAPGSIAISRKMAESFLEVLPKPLATVSVSRTGKTCRFPRCLKMYRRIRLNNLIF